MSWFILLSTIIFSLCDGDGDAHCQWDVKVKNKTMTLDLQRLQNLNKPIECELDSLSKTHKIDADWFLVYTPCRNGVNCSIPEKNVHNSTMVSQISNKSLPSCAAYLGVWDAGKTQPIYDINKFNKEQYIFEYKNGYKQTNGNCTNGRYLNVTYICNDDIELISEANLTCKQLPYHTNNKGICYYEMLIPTKLACLSEMDHGLSRELRATIWLSIILGVICFFYCCVGYIMNGWRYHHWCDCMGNIPNANL
eukprot:UN00323